MFKIFVLTSHWNQQLQNVNYFKIPLEYTLEEAYALQLTN